MQPVLCVCVCCTQKEGFLKEKNVRSEIWMMHRDFAEKEWGSWRDGCLRKGDQHMQRPGDWKTWCILRSESSSNDSVTNCVLLRMECESAQASITKYNRLCGLNNRHLFLTALEGRKSKINVLANFTLSEDLLPDLLILSSYGGERKLCCLLLF